MAKAALNRAMRLIDRAVGDLGKAARIMQEQGRISEYRLLLNAAQEAAMAGALSQGAPDAE
jgi:hypothetical protein